jgi:heme A synthase
MTRRYTQLAWAAAVCTYLLIILGAIVRITGSGLGCGEHWPLCNGRLLPPLDLPTLIEYSHRLAAALVSILVIALAASTWWTRRETRIGSPESTLPLRRVPAAYIAFALLLLQVALGAITVKLALPPWTVILHLGTAMLLLASLLAAARLGPLAWPPPVASVATVLGFVAVLLGALTANLGAATACLGFPLCNGRLIPAGDGLQSIHWAHRLLAYTLTAYVTVWALRTQRRGPLALLGLVALQVAIAAAMVLLALPGLLQAAHVAVGAALWAGLVLVALDRRSGQS